MLYMLHVQPAALSLQQMKPMQREVCEVYPGHMLKGHAAAGPSNQRL